MKIVKNKYFIATILITIFLLTSIVIFSIFSISRIDKIKDFINGDIKILYFYQENKIGTYLEKICSNYELSCQQINVLEYNQEEQKQIQELINNDNIDSTISVFTSGKLTETVIDIDTEEKVLAFLQRLKIMPVVLDSEQTIIDDVNKILNKTEEKTLIYLVYDSEIETKTQEKILEKIALENEFSYKKMDTYLLSAPQRNKLNNLLQISEVNEQIIVCIANGNIMGNIRDVWNYKYKYLSQLKEMGFITTDNFYKKISQEEFEKIISDFQTQVTTITSNDCKYCEELVKIMDNIIVNYNLEINNLKLDLTNEEEIKEIEKKLKEKGYDKDLTTPLTIITQKGEILETIIGSSNEETIIKLFEEYGIIKLEKEKSNE